MMTPAELTRRYFSLGASLYIPALRPDLLVHLNGQSKFSARSLICCTEDALREDEVELALDNLATVLPLLQPSHILRFVRPRNVAVMKRLVEFRGIDRLDGVVLPKVSSTNLRQYAEVLADHPALLVMPTIETELAFDRSALLELRDQLLRYFPQRVLSIRIGGNDLLRCLGLRRTQGLTVYETPLAGVIRDIIGAFRPAGFRIAAPVFEFLRDPETLRRELALDVAHGLYTKTAIHPSQIAFIEQAYRPSATDAEAARRITSAEAPAVFLFDDRMCEPATHGPWAMDTLLREELYGIDRSRAGKSTRRVA